jgi:hypothetical protein
MVKPLLQTEVRTEMRIRIQTQIKRILKPASQTEQQATSTPLVQASVETELTRLFAAEGLHSQLNVSSGHATSSRPAHSRVERKSGPGW